MTISSDLINVMSLKVGASGTAYPCIAFSRTVTVTGPDQTSGVSYRREVWTATCIAVAANLAGVAPLWTTIRGHMCQRGERVTLATWTIERVLPESGDPGETPAERSIAGYPTVELAEVGEQSFGTWLTFRVKAESVVAIVVEEDLVEHDYTVTETQSDEGLISITRRGKVRVLNGVSAREWLDDNLIDDARDAADSAGHAFTVRYTQGLDAAAIEYEFTDADRTTGGGSGIVDSHVDDRSVRNSSGRIVRTVSGWAEGPSAAAFAEDQEPEPDPLVILVRRDLSAASIPDGRVSFSYELLTGVEHDDFPGIVLFSLRETLSKTSLGRSAVVNQFLGGDPVIYNGATAPCACVQSTSIEFIGDWEDHSVVPVLDEDLLAAPPEIVPSGGDFGLRRVSGTFVYVSEADIDVPFPRELNPFT